MAFVLANWSRQSVALNTGEVDVDGVPKGGPAMFSYRADETIATIVAANYFAPAVYDLYVSDLIYIVGNDAVGMYTVATINRAAGTITLTAASLTGAVNTANIVDLAVTTGKLADGAVTNAKVNAAAGIEFSKLEALASGEIIVGSAGGVPTAVAMSGDATIIASGAITLGAVVRASKVGTYAPEAVIAGVPVLHVFNMAAGATATRTIATAQKITVVDAWAVLKGLGTAGDTVQVKNAAGTAITDALDCNAADKALVRAGEIDDGQNVVAAAANLQCTITDGGGGDVPAIDVYVLCYVTP